MAEEIEVRDRRDGFLWIGNNVFDDCLSKLGRSAVLVYTALCRMANNSTQRCFPSQVTLGAMVGLSDRSVRTALKQLQDHGLITWTREGTGSNTYTLTDRKPASGSQLPYGSPLPDDRKPASASTGSQLPPNKTKEQDSYNKTQDDRAVQYLFDYFCQRLGKKNYVFTDARKRMARARLKETIQMRGSRADAVNFMATCIDAMAESAWHNGDNPEGKKYNDFENVFWPKKFPMWVTRAEERAEREESQQEEEWDD